MYIYFCGSFTFLSNKCWKYWSPNSSYRLGELTQSRLGDLCLYLHTLPYLSKAENWPQPKIIWLYSFISIAVIYFNPKNWSARNRIEHMKYNNVFQNCHQKSITTLGKYSEDCFVCPIQRSIHSSHFYSVCKLF